MKITQLSDCTFQVAKQGDMLTDVLIFADSPILDQMKKDICITQGMQVAQLPGIVGKSLMMPDAHQGYGFPIGGVAAMDAKCGCISPGGVGFDINCGMRMLISELSAHQVQDKIKILLDTLYAKVPVGMGKDSEIRLSHDQLDEVLINGARWAIDKGYGTPEDLLVTEEEGCMSGADPSVVSPRAKKRGRFQLGTLGSGNHFLEVQKVDTLFDSQTAQTFGLSKDQVVIMIHCGSRGVGHQICTDFIKRIEDEYSSEVDALPERDLAYAPLGSACADDYQKAMACAMNFAWANRQVITAKIRECFKELFDADLKVLYDMSHNTAKMEVHTVDGQKREVCVHRKGAARAFGPGHKDIPQVYQKTGQPVLIPGSMGTSSYVLAGTKEGMDISFGTTCHGAGRVMSRKKASETFSIEEVEKDLSDKNVSVKAASQRGIVNEAPGVYKDVDAVVKVCQDAGIANIVAKVVPMGVIKG